MRTMLALLLLAPLALAPAPARAQDESPATLRQEAQRLAEQNRALLAEIAALRERVERLTREADALRGILASREPAAPPPAAPISPDPTHQALSSARPVSSDPFAAPDALFVALVLHYAETMPPTRDAQTDLDAPAERAKVRTWTQTARRKFSGQADWLTRLVLLDPDDTTAERRAAVTVLDRWSLEPLGQAFPLAVPERFVAMIEAAASPTQLWEIRAQLDAEPIFQPGRLSPGPFDYPRFIGPHAGFGYNAEMLAINAITEDEARARAAAGKTPDGQPVER